MEDKPFEQDYYDPMTIRDILMPINKIDSTVTVPKITGGSEPLIHVAQFMFLLGYKRAIKTEATEDDMEIQEEKLNTLGSDDWIHGRKKKYPHYPPQDIRPSEVNVVWTPHD